MAVRIICNKCKIKCDEEFFRGFVYSVHSETGKVETFHVCDRCSQQMDEAIINALKEFLDIKGDVALWTMVPYIRQQ